MAEDKVTKYNVANQDSLNAIVKFGTSEGVSTSSMNSAYQDFLRSDGKENQKTYDDIPGYILEALAIKADEQKKKKSPLAKAMGGSISKKRIGANDYRKGGYVLSTMDNRKVKRNGK
jgi:hypothetical protein